MRQINIAEGARTAITSTIEENSFPHVLFRPVCSILVLACLVSPPGSSSKPSWFRRSQVQLEVLRLMGAENLDRFKAGKAFKNLMIRVGGYRLELLKDDVDGLHTLMHTDSREQTRRSIDNQSSTIAPPRTLFERLTNTSPCSQ